VGGGTDRGLDVSEQQSSIGCRDQVKAYAGQANPRMTRVDATGAVAGMELGDAAAEYRARQVWAATSGVRRVHRRGPRRRQEGRQKQSVNCTCGRSMVAGELTILLAVTITSRVPHFTFPAASPQRQLAFVDAALRKRSTRALNCL
jgi:hypothetical protein